MIESMREILLRDLERLRIEVEEFEREEDLWRKLPGTTNSPGVLALHICGNLQHFIGATLGATGYARDRDAEFAAHNTPRAHILAEIGRTKNAVEVGLSKMTDAGALEEFPIRKFMDGRTTGFALLHFLGHMNYHLGQINYARRFRP